MEKPGLTIKEQSKEKEMETREHHYWTLVDNEGNIIMKDSEVDANPLYLGKHKGLAEAIEKFQSLARQKKKSGQMRVAKVSIRIVENKNEPLMEH